METFLLLHLMFLWAQNEFFLCADAIPTLSTESAPFIKDGEYLNITCEVVQHAAAVTWRRNSFSVLIITNTTACSYIKLTSPDTYNYNVTCDQQKRFSMLKYGFNRSDDNTDWSCQVDALDTTDLGISLGVKVYIYKFSPSILYIVGNDSGILSDGDYVPLSVSTGCINPSDSAYYNVTWKYVEATKTVENNFDEKIIRQNVSSSGGCTNTYERNLTFNLIVTNAMNTGNTSLNISQVKMTFTMAGETSIATKNVSYTLIPKVTTTTSSTTTTTTECTIWIAVLVAVLLFVLVVILIVIGMLIVKGIICIKCKNWVIWILIIVAVLLLLAGVILIIMVNIYLNYKNCFIWIIVAVLLLVLGLIVIIIVIICIKCKKCQRRPICISCKKKKCEYCKESCGILICKCEKSFGRLICKFCKMNKCKDCKESAGIVICKCCFMKKCKDCAESARILMCKSDNLKNCDESSGILICTFCKKEDWKGCAESVGMLICKCCDSERSENPEQKLICNCCKQMKCKACSVSSEKESVGILICKCCNLKYKRNHEDGRRSASENGQHENVNKRKPDSSMSNVSRQDIEIQLERNVNRDLERPFGSPNRIVHRDEPNIEPVPFDPNVRRALPSHPITSGENDRNQRGLSANFEDVRGLPSDTPRSKKLPPINLQLESTIQEEQTTVKPRKNKKKKKKNKTGDENRKVDEVAE